MIDRKRPVSILLLLLWLPAISLCHVEKVDWLPHDDCCPSSAAPGSGAPASDPEPWLACCLLASGQYTSEANRIAVPTEHSIWLPTPPIELSNAGAGEDFNRLISPSRGSPEAAVRWHILQRAALAPRAPSALA